MEIIDQEVLRLSSAADLPTKYGTFKIRVVVDEENKEHIAMYMGNLSGKSDVPLRVHSECYTSEVFHSLKCDCRQQLEKALAYIGSQEEGVLIYLRQEGRGIGLFNKIEAYALQDIGRDTIEANTDLGLPDDARSYEVAIKLIKLFGIRSVKLLTNNPLKIEALRRGGVDVSARIPILGQVNMCNRDYLKTKKEQMDHMIEI